MWRGRISLEARKAVPDRVRPASCTQHSDSGPRLGPSARRTSAMMTDDDRKGHNSIWDSIKSGARTFQTADDTSSDGVDGD